jgi:hypothetical protein
MGSANTDTIGVAGDGGLGANLAVLVHCQRAELLARKWDDWKAIVFGHRQIQYRRMPRLTLAGEVL